MAKMIENNHSAISRVSAGAKRWTGATVLGLSVVMALPVVGTLSGALISEGGFSQALAQDDKPKRKTRRTPAIRAKIFEKLTEAQELAEEKKWNESIQVLNDLRDKEGRGALNSYELANLYNMYAFIYFSKEDYKRALSSYQEVIKQPDIPEAMEINTRFTIAQLHFIQENWRAGINELNKWFDAKQRLGEPIGANSYALRAQGYYQLKRYNDALKDIEHAIADYKGKGKVPKEQWYGLARFLNFEKNNINRVIEYLEETLVYYQKKNYWLQLASMYGEKKRDKDMVAAMETAYVQGLLDKDKELINMAYMFLSVDAPYKAAKVIHNGLREKKIDPTAKNLELLGNSWRHAQEVKRAIPVMEAAAKKSDKGELWARLGNIYLDNDEFGKAANAVRQGLKKGGLRRPDTAWLVLGMAEFNLENYDEARKAFREARKDENSKKYAEQWIQFMEREIKRQKSLAEDA